MVERRAEDAGVVGSIPTQGHHIMGDVAMEIPSSDEANQARDGSDETLRNRGYPYVSWVRTPGFPRL